MSKVDGSWEGQNFWVVVGGFSMNLNFFKHAPTDAEVEVCGHMSQCTAYSVALSAEGALKQ